MIAIDTNVLIYACDHADPRRQKIALDLVANTRDGVLLWQVACEFLAASRKLDKQGFTSAQAWNPLDVLPNPSSAHMPDAPGSGLAFSRSAGQCRASCQPLEFLSRRPPGQSQAPRSGLLYRCREGPCCRNSPTETISIPRKFPSPSTCLSPETTTSEPAATAHSRIRLSVGSAGTASRDSPGVTSFANARISWRNACTSSAGTSELRAEHPPDLVEDVFGNGELALTGTGHLEQFKRFPASEEGRDVDVGICGDPVQRPLRTSARVSCTASTAIWIASSSVVASAISRL